MSIEVGSTETRAKSPSRPPSAKTMKVLTVAQAANPMKHAFHGGFQNIAFQTGVVIRLPGDPPNQIYLRTDKKGKHPLPIVLPMGLRAPPNGTLTKVTCTVFGSVDAQGRPYPLLVARMFSIPNILEAEARRTIDLLKIDTDPTESMNKQTGIGNDIHLSGVVVNKKLERRMKADGTLDENQALTFYLRLDADKNNIIPIICDKKLAEQARDKIRYGAMVSVRGQFHTMTMKIVKRDEQGIPVLNEDGSPVFELDAEGNPKVHYRPYIHTGYPTNAPDIHLKFTSKEKNAMPIPDWIETEINAQIRLRMELAKQQNVRASAPVDESKPVGDAIVTKEAYITSASTDRDGGL